jgi:hypothetical protein
MTYLVQRFLEILLLLEATNQRILGRLLLFWMTTIRMLLTQIQGSLRAIGIQGRTMMTSWKRGFLEDRLEDHQETECHLQNL